MEIGTKLKSKVTGEIVTVESKPKDYILGMPNVEGITVYSETDEEYYFLPNDKLDKWEVIQKTQ